MADFTISDVAERTRDWGKEEFGLKTSYYVKITGDDREMELVKARGDEAPRVGQPLRGYEITPDPEGKFPPKLKAPKKGGGNFKKQPGEKYWAAQNRAKGRASSHKVICDLYRLGREEGVFEVTTEPAEFYKRLKSIAEWLDKDVNTVADWPENPYG